MINFILGTFLGGAVGFFAACLCVAAGNADIQDEILFDESSRDK